MFVYVGTYTEGPNGGGQGIYWLDFDPASGRLARDHEVMPARNPSFLALDAEQTHLYAVNELDESTVTAYARDPAIGDLREISRQDAHGADCCYVSLDRSGQFALVANYTSGTIAVLPIAGGGGLQPAACVIQHEGSGADPERQSGPHAHMIAPAPEGRFVLAADLGIDQVLIYELDGATGQLRLNTSLANSISIAPGGGPRHFAFGPDGRALYLLNELNSTLDVFAWDGQRGELERLQTHPTLPDGYSGANACAQVVTSPDGRFVYASNRGHDSIAIWSVTGERGEVTAIGHEPTRGSTPRNFAIDPSGDWLIAANQRSDTLVVFQRERESGLLRETGQTISIPRPVALLFAGG
jgi:6-phosphogluconolactonase